VALKEKPPVDSVQFLSATAVKATSIYPLAKEIADKYHSDGRKFTIVFLPDSHLRHMMYNEGSLSMYSTLKNGFKNRTLDQKDLNLWYAYWVDNIAGFRGHVSPKGSLYLTDNTFRAMNQVKLGLDQLLKDPESNPMVSYLNQRAAWIKLTDFKGVTQPELLAMASLAATLRLFSADQGSQLLKAFRALSASNQKRWVAHVQSQTKVTGTPAPTYAPALFANALILSSLAETIKQILPFYMDVTDKAVKARQSGVLPNTVPLSFRVLANDENVSTILKAREPLTTHIDPETGLATLAKP
jgi:hypothetical protein